MISAYPAAVALVSHEVAARDLLSALARKSDRQATVVVCGIRIGACSDQLPHDVDMAMHARSMKCRSRVDDGVGIWGSLISTDKDQVSLIYRLPLKTVRIHRRPYKI